MLRMITFMSSSAIPPLPMDGKEVIPTPEWMLPPLDLNQLINVSFFEASEMLVLASIEPGQVLVTKSFSPRCPRN